MKTGWGVNAGLWVVVKGEKMSRYSLQQRFVLSNVWVAGKLVPMAGGSSAELMCILQIHLWGDYGHILVLHWWGFVS